MVKKIKWILMVCAGILILYFCREWILYILLAGGGILGGILKKKNNRLHEIQTEEEHHKKVFEEKKALREQTTAKKEGLGERAEDLKERVKKRRGLLVLAFLFLFAAPVQASCEDELDEALQLIDEYQLLVEEQEEYVLFLEGELEYWQRNSQEKTEIILEMEKEAKKKNVRSALIGIVCGILIGVLMK